MAQMALKKKQALRVKSPKPLNFLIIGVGNMGSALVRGLLVSKLGENIRIHLVDTHVHRFEEFASEIRVQAIQSLGSALKQNFDVVVIATKPQDFKSVSEVLAGKLDQNSLVVSLLAAVSIEEIAKGLNFKGAIVRVMSNIAATVGEAATALCKNVTCSELQMNLAHEIFASVGTASWTKESLMNAVTGLSGSGPAYIYMVIEALTDGGVKMGLPRPLALELATQTVVGSGKLVQSSGLHPAVLRDQVTTPGGTTISAIHELEAHGLRSMLMQAVETATNKAKDLSR